MCNGYKIFDTHIICSHTKKKSVCEKKWKPHKKNNNNPHISFFLLLCRLGIVAPKIIRYSVWAHMRLFCCRYFQHLWRAWFSRFWLNRVCFVFFFTLLFSLRCLIVWCVLFFFLLFFFEIFCHTSHSHMP